MEEQFVELETIGKCKHIKEKLPSHITLQKVKGAKPGPLKKVST
jgi:hypothetical protein